jgi:NADH-quinone oxidoreductase subunit M
MTDSLRIKQVALLGSCITWLISLYILTQFDKSDSGYQFITTFNFSTDINYFQTQLILGVDGINIFLVLLTTLLIPICLLSGWFSVVVRIKDFVIYYLILEALLLLVFLVLDLLLFYIFFESVLIPMYLIIGIWGSRDRKILAAYQFFIYTLIGSLFMLLAILWIYNNVGTTNYIILSHVAFSEQAQFLLWLSFFLSFATKIPMIPFHIWLPEAHVEAPTSGSVVLAGILLKLGSFGFLRYSLILFPDASIYYSPFIYTLSILGIIYASLTTVRQIDLKKIIAYSSVAHMSYVTLGLFTFSLNGLQGSLLLMLSHGFISSALFLSIGVVYDRFHTRLLPYYGGLTYFMPIYSLIFIFFTFANISFPGTASFVGELLILLSIFSSNAFVGLLASLGVILSALYSIWLANRLLFGPYNKLLPIGPFDLSLREFTLLLPLILLTLLMGLSPSLFTDFTLGGILYSLQLILTK